MNRRLLRRFQLGILLFASVFGFTAADNSSLPAPPVAKKVPKVTEINGRKLVDNYYWLRDKPNPAVKTYLEAENTYTDAVMKPTEAFQKKLYDEMLGRIKETDVDVPYKEGDYFYYSRTEAGKQYQIRCRKKGSLDAPEEVLLDINEMAKGQVFMNVAAYTVSNDGNRLAYSTDNTGFRQYVLHVKDLRTGTMLPDHAERVGSVVWANDNKTLFYTVEDDAKRQYRLYRHAVGTTGADDLVYEEKDERFDVFAGKSRSKAYIFQFSGSHTTSEVRFISADQPMAEWKVMEPRRQDVEYYPDHNGDFFYIRVNDKGRNFRLVKAPVNDPRSQNWQEVVPHRPSVMVDDTDFFKNYYVLYERENGLPQIRVTNLATGQSRRIEFPEPAYLVFAYVNREYDTAKLRYNYQSFITPQSIFEYDMEKGTSTLLKQKEVPGGYDRTRYQVEQVYATAKNGVKVPISAGGLLMGAVLNMRPDLFHAALVGVPFVDVINTMLDESLPLTVPEFEEWGNPKEKPAFDYMISYSPYDNVEAKTYPNILVKTSFNDSQVMYWEPAKYVAKMRALRTDHNTLMLKTNLDPAGHGGASGRYDRLKEAAFDYAFILTQMGIAN